MISSFFAVTDFATEVLERSRTVPVLVDFWAEWCGPCRILGPVIERLAVESQGEWELRKLNTEEFPDIASRYGIRSIPAVKLFVDGRPHSEFVGALPEPQIRAWLAKALPEKFAQVLDQAEAKLRSGVPDQAAALLKPILAQAPHHERARTLAAAVAVLDKPEEALALMGGIDEGSRFGDQASSLRTIASLMLRRRDGSAFPDHAVKTNYIAAVDATQRRDFDAALSLFIQIIRDHRPFDDDGSRKACIALFRYLGEEHEITLRHRRDFGSALYV